MPGESRSSSFGVPSAPSAPQHPHGAGDLAAGRVGDDDVGTAVPVQVRGHDGRTEAGGLVEAVPEVGVGDLLGRERPTAEDHVDVLDLTVGVLVGVDPRPGVDDVRDAVTVHIDDPGGDGIRRGGRAVLRCLRACTAGQRHGDQHDGARDGVPRKPPH